MKSRPASKHLDHLVGVYIVAAKLKDPAAQNKINREIMENIASSQASRASFDAVYAIPKEAAETSLLRQILVDNVVEWPEELKKGLPRGKFGEILEDNVTEQFAEMRDNLVSY